MDESRKRILDMLASGKISVDEAEKLLAAVTEATTGPVSDTVVQQTARPKPRYLRIEVDSGDNGAGPEKVNIRVPLQLLRAGVKLASLIPQDAQTKINQSLRDKGIGINLSDLNPDTIEELVESLGEISINVDSGEEKVRIYSE